MKHRHSSLINALKTATANRHRRSDAKAHAISQRKQPIRARSMAITLSVALIPATSLSAAPLIDMLVLHSPGLAARYAGDASTRINHLVNVTNQIYADSGLDTRVRAVHNQQVNYSDTSDSYEALKAVTYKTGAFRNLDSLRSTYGADMVTFLRPYDRRHGGCGIAWIGGNRSNGTFSANRWDRYMISHVSATTCGDYVMAHEAGHNMGLKHSRKQDGSGGTFRYALGYGVQGKFTTIMAYQSRFGVDYWRGKIYKFSSPSLSCNGLPCGIDRNDYMRGADAAYALSQTTPQIAAFRPTKITEPTTKPTDGKPDTPDTTETDLERAYNAWLKARESYFAALQTKSSTQRALMAAQNAQRSADRALLYAGRFEAQWNQRIAGYSATAARYQALADRYSGALQQRYQNIAQIYQDRASQAAQIRDGYRAKIATLKAEKNATDALYNTANNAYTGAIARVSEAITAYNEARKAYIVAKRNSSEGVVV